MAAQLRSWWAANPFLSGIHWTSGIELGVRLLSWVWIRRLLDGWAGAGPLFEGNRTFLQQLHHHQEWLARLPSHGSSANNHIVAEMAGQFAASCAFPWFPESTAWREAAASTLRRELAGQTLRQRPEPRAGHRVPRLRARARAWPPPWRASWPATRSAARSGTRCGA